MRYITKILTPAILAVSLVAIAGCDSESQAQTVQGQSVQAQTAKLTSAANASDQISSAKEGVEKIKDAVKPAERPDVQTWTVDAEKSYLKFSAWQEGEEFGGEFKTFTADIKFHPDNLEGSSVTVTVPLSGVDAGSTDRNSTLPGKGWFSVKKFPDAVFTAKIFKPMGEGAYDAVGELTLKGITRELSLPFTLDIEGDTAVMRSTLEMDRTNWSVGEAPWNTGDWVSTEVKLDIVVSAQITK